MLSAERVATGGAIAGMKQKQTVGAHLGRPTVTSLYIDSNVVFRLGQNEELLAGIEAAQRRQAVRVVIGWMTVWELAGVFASKPEVIPKARDDAGVVLRLLESGGCLATSPWNVALAALKRPAADRWIDNGILARSSDDFRAAIETLQLIRDPANDEVTRAWYQSVDATAKSFRAAEQGYRQRIAERSGGRKPRIVKTLAASLDSLEVRGWLPDATAAVALQLGECRERPQRLTSDWFGPLGRVMRASIAFSMLHATSPSSAGVPPKHSDYADVMHIVGAGLVKRFVTADATAMKVFNATWPPDSRSAMLFPQDFSRYIEAQGGDVHGRADEGAV